MQSKFIDDRQGPIVPTGNTLDFALSSPNTFFKVQDKTGEVVYTRDGAFKILNGFLVDSKGQFILNNANEPISTEDEFINLISVVKIDYSDIEKHKDNNFKVKDGALIETFDFNDTQMLQGAIETSNVNSVTAMVGLIDAHRRFDQSQRAIKTIDELNGKVIDKIGNNTR